MSTDRRPTAPRPRTQTPHREPVQEGDRYSLVDQGRLSAPLPVPAKGYRPMPVPVVDTPLPESLPPKSFSPPPGATELDVAAIKRAARRQGVPVSIPPPAQPEPAEEYPPRNLRPLEWYKTTDGTIKVIGAVVAGLLSLGVGGWIANHKPAPELAPILAICPRLPADATREERDKQPDVCRMIWKHELEYDRLYGRVEALEKREERERLLKEQTPPAAIITGRPPN